MFTNASHGLTSRSSGRTVLSGAGDAARVSILLVAAIWIVQAFNVADHYRLDSQYGITSRQISSLPYVLTAPFLHVSVQHIESNTLPLAVLAFISALGGLSEFFYASAIIVIGSGLGTWLISPPNVFTVGASGLIFGYLGFVALRGFFQRSIWQIVIGVAAFAYYQWALVLVFPNATVNALHISWQDHLSGLIFGVLAAYIVGRQTRRESAGQIPSHWDPPSSLTH